MTKTQLKKKFNELKKENNKMIDKKFEKALTCGALDISSYENDYRLAKILMTAKITDPPTGGGDFLVNKKDS